MVELKIESFGDVQVARDLQGLGDRADSLEPAFDVMHDSFIRVVRHHFDSQGRGTWRPLAPATIDGKRRAGLDPRILHATLRLRKSLTQKSHPEHVYDPGRNGLNIGSSVPYGVHHQFGAPRAGLPMRKPVDLTERTRRNWVKILQRYIVTGKT